MKFSELSSYEHHERANSWRGRIRGAKTAWLMLTLAMLMAFLITGDSYWAIWAVVATLICIVAIALMFIPLVRHNRRDDLF